MPKQIITLGHSPDSDDAFMFYAMAKGKIDTGNYDFQHVLQDIQTLNERAGRQELDVTAISLHAYAHVLDNYALLPSGASVGDRYGPLVVAREAMSIPQLAMTRIAVPGTLTTAFLALQLLLHDFEYVVLPFDAILPAVAAGEVEAGLIIHEGQLTYEAEGVQKVCDLGEWWYIETGLPLPLGVNVIRKALGPQAMSEISAILTESIRYALDHRKDALEHALQYGRGLDGEDADRFVGMYVNELTLDLGERGRQGVTTLLERAHQQGLIPGPVNLEFVA